MRVLRNLSAVLFLLAAFTATPRASLPANEEFGCYAPKTCTLDSKYTWTTDSECFNRNCTTASSACVTYCDQAFGKAPHTNTCTTNGIPTVSTDGICQCFSSCVFIPE